VDEEGVTTSVSHDQIYLLPLRVLKIAIHAGIYWTFILRG